uniref:DUF2339 domain-containing protein n=1 Tax=Geminicoccus flavidas TaxID=2506407 RepID=UPI001358F531
MEAVWLVLVVVAAAGWSQQRREIRRLAARLDALEGRRPAAPTMPPVPAMPAAPVAASAGPVEQSSAAPPAALAAPPPALPPGSDLERRFGQRWLVWIGAVALALGGLFVVQYSIEQDLIGPRTRLAFGLLTGIVLILMAELLRKQPGRLGLSAGQTAGAAAALAAGGASALFGVAWASFDRYGLLGPELALAAMALAAATALLLAWHHGPLLAVVALVFAYLAPVLTATASPDPVAFAVWLVAIQLFLGLLLRFRPWTWLLALDLLGLIPLGILLMAGSQAGTTLAPLVAAAAVALPVWLAREPDWPEDRPPVRALRRVAGVGGRAWLGGLLLAASAVAASEQSDLALLPLPIAALVLVTAALVARARLHVAFAGAFAVAIAAALIDLPIVGTAMAEMLGDPVTATPAWRWLAPELASYAWFCALTAAAFFLAGWTGALHARPSGGFAALAVVVPLVLLAIAYARIEGFAAAPRWTVVALVMAGLFLLAAERTARFAGQTAAVAAFALGVVAALSLAFTMALEHAWLSVALAAQVLAVVLVHARFPHSALASAAAALVGLVAGRLLWQAGEAGTSEQGILLVLWAYGVPTLFLLGAWLCGRRLEPFWSRDVILLAATLGWIIVLMRAATALAGGGRHDDLLEPGLQVAALTLTTAGLALRPQTGPVRLATLLTLLV